MNRFNPGPSPAIIDREVRFLDLVRALPEEMKLLARQEAQLAKIEMSEKIAGLRSHLTTLAIGGGIAGTAALLLLLSLGFFLAFAFQQLGWNEALAEAVGFATVGILGGIIGFLLLRKSIRCLSNLSLTPEKTMETLKGNGAHPEEPRGTTAPAPVPPPSAEKLQEEVSLTQKRVHFEIDEIQRRLHPAYFLSLAIAQIQRHPKESSLAGAGLATLWLWKRRRRSKC